jgi:hypothetical protein
VAPGAGTALIADTETLRGAIGGMEGSPATVLIDHETALPVQDACAKLVSLETTNLPITLT